MRLLFCSLSLASLTLMGCQLMPTTPVTQATPTPAPLTDTRWHLQHIDGQAILPSPPERAPYLQFSATDHRVTGMGGCNRLMGSYTQHGDRLDLVTASTRMACMDDKGQETRLMQALSTIRRFHLDAKQLHLRDEQGKARLSFVAD
jgi:heat shock protein HslJ